jgi:hypothetical protein
LSTFTDNLEEMIVLLDMWTMKRQDDMPTTAAWLATASRDLTVALEQAKKGN